MKNKIIQLKGIERDSSLSINEEGTCTEIINLKYDNKAWRPDPQRKTISNFDKFIDQNTVIKHTALSSEYYLILINDLTDGYSLYLYDIDDDNTLIDTYVFDDTYSFRDYKEIGNTLILSFKTGMYKLLWDEDTGKYINLSELPESIHMYIDSYESSVDDTEITDNLPSGVSLTGVIYDLGTEDGDEAIERYKALQKLHRDNGYITGSYIVRFALQMFDGNYIMHSSPVISTGLYDSSPTKASSENWKTKMVGRKYKYKLYNNIISDIVESKKIVSAVIIACTSAFSNCYPVEEYTIGGEKIEIESTFTDLTTTFENASYHIVERIPVETLEDDNDHEIEINQDKLTNVETNEVLTIDDAQSHLKFNIPSNGKLESYNSRLALTKVQYEFPALRMDYLSMNKSSDATYSTIVIVKIKYKGITYVVKSEHNGYVATSLWGIVTYPDRRAYQIIIVENKAGVYKKAYDIKLTSINNIAYAFPDTIDTSSSLMHTADSLTATFTRKDTAMLVGDIPEGTNILEDTYSVRFSETNNPWRFDTTNTYTFEGEIDGIGVATYPLSTGQYGQFPVYVFTQKGIKALEIGSGTTLFSRITPVSREICDYVNTIKGTELGILFANENGLYLLQGSETKLLTDKIDKIPDQGVHASPDYKLFVKDTSLTGITTEVKDKFPDLINYIDTVSFLSYVQDSFVEYLGGKNKIVIITNPSYSSSYILSLKTGLIYKQQYSYSQTINSYPNTLAVKRNTIGLFNLNTEDPQESYSKIMLETNPISVRELNFTVNRIIVRGYLNPYPTIVCGVYLFVSDDTFTWKLAGYKQTTEKVKDIALAYAGGNYKYIKLLITGKLNKDSYINYIELQESYLMKGTID